MDNQLVALLADAAATLDAAMERTESGSPEWERILESRESVERLVAYAVSGDWPQASD